MYCIVLTDWGDDKIKILELDFLHLQEGVGHKMMRFGENQSSLA